MQELKCLVLTADFLGNRMATILDACDLFVKRLDISARIPEMADGIGLIGGIAPEQLLRSELLQFIERSTYLRQDVVSLVAMSQLTEFGFNRLQIALEAAQLAL